MQIVAPLLLTLTILSLWLAPRAWATLLLLTILAGYAGGRLTGLAGMWVVTLAGACYAYAREFPGASQWLVGLVKALSLAGIVGLSIGLSIHVLPGFHNIQLQPPTKLTPAAIPYDEWINFDKTIAGILVLGICFRKLITDAAQLRVALRRAAIPTIVTIVLVVLLSVAFGYVRWEPKWTSQFWLWAAINLLATCMSEEAFFRAFIQTELERLFAPAACGAIACSAALFGIAHIAGGWHYVTLAAVAGAGYGTVFYRSRSIELSVFAHFALNSVHFLLFTYPALAPH
jgi:membrane protease YdiL (CAAX protease family)